MNPFLNNVDRLNVHITKGDGIFLWDELKQRWLMDFWSDEATQPLGYGMKMNGIIHRFTVFNSLHQLPEMFPNDTRTNAAQRLLEAYGYDKIFFSNSGAEANETALKLVRKYWYHLGKPAKQFCYTIQGNFHGRSYGSLGLSDSAGSGSPYHKTGFHPYDANHPVVWAGYGAIDDTQLLQAEYHDFRRIMLSQIDPKRTAAIFMAPVLGNNCVKTYPTPFFENLRLFCDNYDTLLVFDEIQTGSGWTGTYAYYQQTGIMPDVITLGKRMALGFPMSATLMIEGIGDVIHPGEHFNTFGGSPFVSAMALEWLAWLEAEQNDPIDGLEYKSGLERIQFMGEFIESQLWTIPSIKAVNRAGMMCSFTLDWDEVGFNGCELTERCLEHDLILVTHRPSGEIRFTPPVIVTEQEVREAVQIIIQSIAELL